MRAFKWVLGVVTLVAIAGFVIWMNIPPPVMTPIDITILGGFQYVHSISKDTYEIAYLNAVSNGTCQAPQTKARLRVITGTIASAPSSIPANKTFDINGTKVSFSGTFAKGAPPTNPPPSGNQPANPDNPGDWTDVKWVPSVFKSYSTNSIKTGWRDLTAIVNGRVTLPVGTLVAAKPTEPAAVHAVFDFSSASGAPTPFSQAITNETVFSTILQGSSLTINLIGGPTPGAVVVTPKNGKIQLALMGEHPGGPPSLPAGGAIDDFCAYYELLTTPVDVKDRLLPHFPMTPPGYTGSMAGAHPIPGVYCSGNDGGEP